MLIMRKLFVSILTGSSPEEEGEYAQNYKYKNNGFSRKVIFATEVAESSMTFDGVDFVIDTGLSYINIYYPDKDLTALELKEYHKHLINKEEVELVEQHQELVIIYFQKLNLINLKNLQHHLY